MSAPGRGTALRTDHYELTMLSAALQAGVAGRPCVFEVFARRLPPGRRYGVVAGVGRLVEALAAFRFATEELAWLRAERVVDDATLDWLAGYRFAGTVSGYAEGELYFPGSPVLTVEASFAEAVLLETLVLSHLNFDSAIASAAARMVVAARGRTLLEFGARRTHEEAAVAAARAAYLAGFAGTSDLEAGFRHGVPTSGTSAHAFMLLFADESEAFRAQVARLGSATTLLVDTYDSAEGIRRAVAAAGTDLGAIRIDSGNLAAEAATARALLDALGATGTRIVMSGDLDEYVIDGLRDAPIDAFGVGTRLVTGSGAPTGEFIYKLVAVAREDGPDAPLVPVAKAGGVKATVGGRKRAWRDHGPDGIALAEVVIAADDDAPRAPASARLLQRTLLVDGAPVDPVDLDATRAFHRTVRGQLPAEGLRLDPGPPALPTTSSVLEEV